MLFHFKVRICGYELVKFSTAYISLIGVGVALSVAVILLVPVYVESDVFFSIFSFDTGQDEAYFVVSDGVVFEALFDVFELVGLAVDLGQDF